jgi:hypothetical protein
VRKLAKRGQSSLEYVVIYGVALLIVVVLIVGVYRLAAGGGAIERARGAQQTVTETLKGLQVNREHVHFDKDGRWTMAILVQAPSEKVHFKKIYFGSGSIIDFQNLYKDKEDRKQYGFIQRGHSIAISCLNSTLCDTGIPPAEEESDITIQSKVRSTIQGITSSKESASTVRISRETDLKDPISVESGVSFLVYQNSETNKTVSKWFFATTNCPSKVKLEAPTYKPTSAFWFNHTDNNADGCLINIYGLLHEKVDSAANIYTGLKTVCNDHAGELCWCFNNALTVTWNSSLWKSNEDTATNIFTQRAVCFENEDLETLKSIYTLG